MKRGRRPAPPPLCHLHARARQLAALSPPGLARRRRTVVVRLVVARRVVPAARVVRRLGVAAPASAFWTRRWIDFRPRSIPELAAAVPFAVSRSSCRFSLRFSLISSSTIDVRLATASPAVPVRRRVAVVLRAAAPRVVRVVRVPVLRRARRFGAGEESLASAIVTP
jgi:hypothetical protein